MAEVPKRIHLLGDGRHEEALASAALTPGHLIELISTGKVRKHASAGVRCEKLFALEDALQGRTIDTAYAADELVGFVVCQPGDVVYAWLNVGESVVPGDLLVSNGDGTLQKLAGSEIALAVSLDTLNLSDSEHAPARIRARIL